MSKKIKLITIILLIITLLPINVSAAIIDEKQYFCLVPSANYPGLQFVPIATLPTSLGIGSTGTLFIGYQTNEIIPDGTVMVMTVILDNQIDTQPRHVGVGQMASGAITSTHTGDFFLNMPYDQEIIATTVQLVSEGTRITVTSKAQGYTNKYPFMRIEPITPIDSNWAVKIANLDLYDTVLEAGGSGTTPEEMREVLSQWGQEELIPGIEDSVQSGVQSGMEAALEDEKQQANTDGNSAIDELTGALEGVVDDIDQAKEAFNTLGSALQYSGTSASLTFPGMNVPFLGQISEPINFDMTGYIDRTFPPQLLLLIRCALSIGIVSYPIFELVRQLRKLLDKG